LRRTIGALTLGALALSPSAVSADTFTPIRMQVSIAPIARLHQPLAVNVAVTADQGVLDVRSGPVRARVKLTSGECGGTFDTSPGDVLLDRALAPQPDPSEPYSGSAAGSGRPSSYGPQALCVFLEDDYQQFASDTTGYQVNVSKGCTDAAASYDSAAASLERARRALRHAHSSASRSHLEHLISQRRAAAASAKHAARAACGPGVPI